MHLHCVRCVVQRCVRPVPSALPSERCVRSVERVVARMREVYPSSARAPILPPTCKTQPGANSCLNVRLEMRAQTYTLEVDPYSVKLFRFSMGFSI